MEVTVNVLLSADELQAGVRRLAAAIDQRRGGRPLTVIGVLTGSVVLLADLVRLLPGPLRIGVVQARSYQGAVTEPGELIVHADLLPDVRGQEVLVVDDIFDTGRTLAALVAQLTAMGAVSVQSAVLLRKTGRAQVDYRPDLEAFQIPDEFVVGYGMDYLDLFRNLKCVAALSAEDQRTAEAWAAAPGGPEPAIFRELAGERSVEREL